MGTPEFSLPSLDSLYQAHWNLAGVVTQPDRPQGRGSKIFPSPVKKRALEYHLPLLQPQKVKDPTFLEKVHEISPTIIVVVAFGQILPPDLLNIPRHGCVNLHASYLPHYRGAAPIQWAIINGEKKTGVTIIKMNEKMDEGDILSQDSIPIEDDETAEKLSEKLANRGAKLLIQTLKDIENHREKPIKQDDQKASYAPSLKKEDGKIVWGKTAEQIRNLIRGTDPWPGAYTFLDKKRLRIMEATVAPSSESSPPGRVLVTSPEGLRVATGNGILIIKEVQPENKRKMRIQDFLAGHSVKSGMVMG